MRRYRCPSYLCVQMCCTLVSSFTRRYCPSSASGGATGCHLPTSFRVGAGWLGSRRARVQIAVATLSRNSLRQTVYTHCDSVHQAAKLVAAILRVSGVTAGLAESNDSLPPGLWLTSPAGWLPRTGISSGTLRSVIEYGLPFLPLECIMSELSFFSSCHSSCLYS